MALRLGTTLGPYSVTAKIGEGGMGEVYQARDTKLDRDVALKVLPEAFTADPDRLARFEREAKVLASLNHPNIGSIYGLEEAEGVRALVLELVEGPTLADRIKRGAIPIDEALPIAKQIAEALEAAHEQGVIHRDLKPANIKVKDDGTVKVLDFGLAKAFQPDAGDPNLSQSPTISLTAAATQMGMVIGTAAYMAPEQASGKAVDKRADVWAFGVVLYEMLTGTRPFVGDDVSKTLAHVIAIDPDWSALPKNVPPVLGTFLHGCLEKNPKQRVHDVADVRLALEGAFETSVGTPSEPIVSPKLQLLQRPVPAGAVLLGVAVATGLAVWIWLGGSEPPNRPMRFTITLPEFDQFTRGSGSNLAVSPDGRTLVYRAIRDGSPWLFQRPIDHFQATAMPNTEGGTSPFFSADGRSVLFSSGGEFQRVALAGGPSQTLTASGGPVGADWAPDDTIVYGTFPGGDLMSVSATGGEPTAVFTPEAGERAWHPQRLQGGDAVLFTLSEGSPDASELHLLMLDTSENRTLLPNALAGRVLNTGHLVFLRSGALWAVPFDRDRLETVGNPAPVVEGVRVEGGGSVQYAVADNGTLVYIPGEASTGRTRSLLWVDRGGSAQPLAVPPRDYQDLSLSPDGSRAALAIAGMADNAGVWVADLARGTLHPITREDGTAVYPLWSPDGSQVVFMSRRGGRPELFSTAADGTGPAERIASFDESVTDVRPYAWSPDGGVIVQATYPDTGRDIGVVSLEGTNGWQPLIQTTADEGAPAIAPNGRWIVYSSRDSGRSQIYVQRFPDLSRRCPVTADVSYGATWSRDGRELFYLRGSTINGPPDAVMRVTVEDGDTAGEDIVLGDPEVLVDFSYSSRPGAYRTYDVSRDGRLLVLARADVEEASEDSREINVVLNWTQELLDLVPIP